MPKRCRRLALSLALPFVAVSASQAQEPHLADVRQLTQGGENAEAYWSPDGSRLIFQRTGPEGGCDQIFSLPVDAPESRQRLSSGQGRTTCAYSLPDGKRFLYSTTGLVSPECPAPPDRSRGYVWPIYHSYEIVLDPADGSAPVRLTDNDAYDAEATVCPTDGSIVFTSDRDGDLDLYRMDPDGENVVRLTQTPGYDGGAFFSADCSKIVWRASRPEGDALEDYRSLLEEGLVRPGRLELWVANADGSDARQVTYLGAASFAPYFFPSGDRIIFSSNYGDPQGREFELWAVDVQGTRLERLTRSPGFDGFPMFSPDGTMLAFGTNRFPGGPHETNVAVARWVAAPPRFEESAADRYLDSVRWLADDAREGRGIGTAGLAAAGEWLESRFRELGLEPGGEDGYRQRFEVAVSVRPLAGTRLTLDGRPLELGKDYGLTGFSASASASGAVVAAGYGIQAPELSRDDFASVDVKGKVALVRRFVPDAEPFKDPANARRYGDIRRKAFAAREQGAVALVVVDLPEAGEAEEAPLPSLRVEGRGDAGIPVIVLKREVGQPLFEGTHTAEMTVELAYQQAEAFNVVGRLTAPADRRREGALVLGAHYDHLGLGGPGSLEPESHEPHNGADDNASGTAALLEAARELAGRRGELERDVWFVAFSGEESGLVGSTVFTRKPPADLPLEKTVAMVNFDMVGRLRNGELGVLGGDSAEEWQQILPPLCKEVGIRCSASGDGYGPSDQTPFYAAGIPVLHFFTGVHDDYHKPSDDADKINAAGGARVALLAARLAEELSRRAEPLTYKQVPPPPPAEGDVRSYGASLGTIPDFVGLPEGKTGVLLAGVRPGGPAERAGLQRGDLLVGLAGREIKDLYDFMYILQGHKPGETVTAVVERDGRRLEVKVTFGKSRRR